MLTPDNFPLTILLSGHLTKDIEFFSNNSKQRGIEEFKLTTYSSHLEPHQFQQYAVLHTRVSHITQLDYEKNELIYDGKLIIKLFLEEYGSSFMYPVIKFGENIIPFTSISLHARGTWIRITVPFIECKEMFPEWCQSSVFVE